MGRLEASRSWAMVSRASWRLAGSRRTWVLLPGSGPPFTAMTRATSSGCRRARTMAIQAPREFPTSVTGRPWAWLASTASRPA